MEKHHAGVVVIGGGAAGAAVTWRLATSGVDVCCLEQGGWVRPSDYPTTRPGWELERETSWNPNPNVRRSRWDYPVIDDTTPIKPLLFNGVGGSTVMWSAHAPRFHPSDFRVRALDGVADDWPLQYADLAGHYELNDEMMGVAGLAGDPAYPSRQPRQTPPVPLGGGGRRIAAAFEARGWHWWPCDVNVNTRPYGPGRGACVNCGPCELGCVHGAKGDVSVTYWPAALAAGARLLTEARVRSIEVDDRGRATGVRYLQVDGTERRITADAVVLAASGLGTPRMLLASTSTAHPRGLANSSGMIGQRLMLHPIASAVGVFDEQLDGHEGIAACSIYSHEFYETDRDRGFVRGYQLQVTRSHPPAKTALGGFGVDVPWGERHHERFAEVFGRTAGITVLAEDLPNEANQVTLDRSRVDGGGVPVPRMTYQVDRNARAALDHGLDRAEEVLRDAGAKEVHKVRLRAAAGFHLMGTARMGEDPDTSVVDPFGRSYDVDNLFVADSSLFVTAAAVNPTPTLQALALRAADRLVQAGPLD